MGISICQQYNYLSWTISPVRFSLLPLSKRRVWSSVPVSTVTWHMVYAYLSICRLFVYWKASSVADWRLRMNQMSGHLCQFALASLSTSHLLILLFILLIPSWVRVTFVIPIAALAERTLTTFPLWQSILQSPFSFLVILILFIVLGWSWAIITTCV